MDPDPPAAELCRRYSPCCRFGRSAGGDGTSHPLTLGALQALHLRASAEIGQTAVTAVTAVTASIPYFLPYSCHSVILSLLLLIQLLYC